MHGVLFQDDVLIGHDVGIGQVDSQRGVVVAQIGAEQERRACRSPGVGGARESGYRNRNSPSALADDAPMSPWLSQTTKVSLCFSERRGRVADCVAEM